MSSARWLLISLVCATSLPCDGSAEGLLIGAFRSGRQAGWGVYQWHDDGLKLLVKGGRSPAWHPSHEFFACLFKDGFWLQRSDGETRLVDWAGAGPVAGRFSVRCGGDGLVVSMDGDGEFRRLLGVDAGRALRLPRGTWAADINLVYPGQGALTRLSEALLAQMNPYVVRGVVDFDLDASGRWVGLAHGAWMPEVGLLRSQVGILDLRTGTWQDCGAPGQVIATRPRWASGKRLLFQLVDPATGRRSVADFDVTTGRLGRFEAHGLEHDPGSLRLLAPSPDGRYVAVGFEPVPGARALPSRLAVLSAQGEFLCDAGDTFGLMDVAWSRDSTKLAYLHIQTDAEPSPLPVFYAPGGTDLSVLHVPERRHELVWMAELAQDSQRDDPLALYELAW